jgi:hypothetical protein
LLISLTGCSSKTIEVVKVVTQPEFVPIPESFMVPCSEDYVISLDPKGNRMENIIRQSLERKTRLDQCRLRLKAIIDWSNSIKKDIE